MGIKAIYTNGKPYPQIDGHRKHYVRYPVQITQVAFETTMAHLPNLKVGEWVAVDVLLKGYSHLVAPINFDTKEKCQKACDMHNKSHGWTPKEVDQIISLSMDLKTFKKKKHENN